MCKYFLISILDCLILRITTEEVIMLGTYIIILVQSYHLNGPISILAAIPTATVK